MSEQLDLANGAGMIVALADTVSGVLIAGTGIFKGSTALGTKVMPKIMAKYFAKEATSGMGKLAKALGRAAITEGGTEGSQEFIQIMAENMRKTYDGTETSFIAAGETALKQWRETGKRVGTATVLGAVGGPAFQLATTGASKTLGTTLKVGAKGVEVATSKLKKPVYTVNEEGQYGFGDPEFNKQMRREDVLPDQVADKQRVERGVRTAQAAQIMMTVYGGTKGTKMETMIPEELEKYRQKVFEKAGQPYIYVDIDKVDEWEMGPESKGTLNRVVTDLDKNDFRKSFLN
jgi:hypothetical protein